jgi:hypothetical protein
MQNSELRRNILRKMREITVKRATTAATCSALIMLKGATCGRCLIDEKTANRYL